MDVEALRQWLAALDSISYYELFRVDHRASHDDLREAFHAFAETFHPDSHLWRHPNEQAAIGRIYRRGTEAWRVLADPTMRARYDEAVANGILRPENLIVEMEVPRSLAPPPPPGAAARLVDSVRSLGARPFVTRCEELFKKGDLKQAKIQLVMAMHMERGNRVLQAFDKHLDESMASKTDDERMSENK